MPIRLYTLYSWYYSQLEDTEVISVSAEQKQFSLQWEKAYEHYIAGDWRVNKCKCTVRAAKLPVLAAKLLEYFGAVISEMNACEFIDHELMEHLKKCTTHYLFQNAGTVLRVCRDLYPLDGPTSTLLKFIQNRSVNGNAPKSWRGVRSYVEKKMI